MGAAIKLARNAGRPVPTPVGVGVAPEDRQPQFIQLSDKARMRVSYWKSDDGKVYLTITKQYLKRGETDWQNGKGTSVPADQAANLRDAISKMI